MKKFFLIIVTVFSINTLSAQNNSINTLLETVGALSAQGIFITYTSIGTLADGYVEGVYDDDFTIEILSQYVVVSEAVNNQFNELLRKGDLHGNDIGLIIELNNIYELLISEADAFRNFVMTKDKSYLHIYDDSRVRAWNKIALLFEIE
tara:strand:- start:70 stop:516 length:447 start_codon:yes stop_codon:yes gene_type:complete